MTAGNDLVVLVMSDPTPPDPAEVDRWLRERLDGWPDHEAAVVGVVAGELVRNAWRHGAAPYLLELRLDREQDVLVVSALDRPARRSRPWRLRAGLLLVDALAVRWGVESRADRTRVWAELRFD
ncbi:ATP-binding protein [Saccharothrix obliqua]|uniref:ATP-binding protein n=1 Tax=Saccharothrix obliqua TaxID=2861747 RepID=UPI001C5D62E1|nr:ATP-binding protein [Saccharothrix obliqua]MBW4720484.1 ATP-binding protein [Saccharothrix obliqua]